MKLKKLLNENLWNERKFGEPLPTLEDTTKRFKMKQEELSEKKNHTAGDKDVKTVASMIGKSPLDVRDFVNQYDLDADDLIDVLDSGADRRRNALMVMAAMKGNRRALRKLDDLLGLKKFLFTVFIIFLGLLSYIGLSLAFGLRKKDIL